MSKDPQTLQDVARAALSRHEVSGRELERYAKKHDRKIAYTTINHIAAGTYKSRPSRETLQALAFLSGYTVEQVYAAAEQPLPLAPLADDLPDDADLLTGPQRRVIVDAIRLFAQQNRELAALTDEQKGGGERELGSASNSDDATVTQLPGRVNLPEDFAASDPGSPSQYEEIARSQDAAAERSQDESGAE